MEHRSVHGCLCRACEAETIDNYRLSPGFASSLCAGPGCPERVVYPGFWCCFHYWHPEARSVYVTPNCACHALNKRNTMATNDLGYQPFYVFSDGSLQYSCLTLDVAKEKAQELIRAKKCNVIIYEAILKITPKPVETVETDLRSAKS